MDSDGQLEWFSPPMNLLFFLSIIPIRFTPMQSIFLNFFLWLNEINKKYTIQTYSFAV